MISKASLHFSDQKYTVSLFVRACNGAASVEKFFMNLLTVFAKPNHDCSSFKFVGSLRSKIAFIFSGSAFISFPSMM